MTQEKNDGKLKSFLVFATIVAEVLKKNLELDRIDLEAEYFFESTEDNFRLELDDIYNQLMKSLSSADDKAIADILDTRFFCKILFSLKENSFVSDEENLKINVKKIFESDIDEHPEILNDFVELSEKFPNFSFDRVQTFDPSIFHAFKIERKIIPRGLEETQKNVVGIARIKSPLYEEYTKDLFSNIDPDSLGFLSNNDLSLFVNNYKVFEEKYHWHFLKPLTDDYDRTPENYNPYFDQKKANFMVKYGTSLEGRIETEKPIVANKDSAKSKSEGKLKQSCAVVEIHKGKLKSDFEAVKKELEVKKLEMKNTKDKNLHERLVKLIVEIEKKSKEFKEKAEALMIENNEKKTQNKKNKKINESIDLSTLREEISNFFGEIQQYFYLKMMKENIDSIEANEKLNKDTIQSKIEFVRTLSKFMKLTPNLDDKHKSSLSKYLSKLGFYDLALSVGLEIKKMDESRKVSFSRFQLENMGAYLEHETPAEKDKRVDKFNPDKWQRDMFDVIDKRGSALIIAPTSSGKTFASYYCMEQVLRESDDGVVVYVSPTKALVNQVYKI